MSADIIAALLAVLDGTEATALSVATGLTPAEITDLGGLG